VRPHARPAAVAALGVTTRSGPPDVAGILVAERARTVAQIEALTRTFDDVVRTSELDITADDEHDPDGATIAFERAQVVALLRQARADLAELDLAVARLADGTYGTCTGCGRAIPPERLEARPAARTCVTCIP
jgi:DnaK suppressor protein